METQVQTEQDFNLEAGLLSAPQGDDIAPLPQGDYAVKITGVEAKATKSGGKQVVVETVVVNGKFEGRKIKGRYNVLVKPNVEKVLADKPDMDPEEAATTAAANASKAMEIGNSQLAGIANAAGFINPNHLDPKTDRGRKNAKRVEAGTAVVIVPGDFKLKDIVGRTIMVRTKGEPSQDGSTVFQTIKSAWDAANVGDLSGQAPF